MLGVENVPEVLISVQWSISEYLVVRVLAANPVLACLRGVRFRLAAVHDRCHQVAGRLLFFYIDRVSVGTAASLRFDIATIAAVAWVEVNSCLAGVLLERFTFGFFEDLVVVTGGDLLTGQVFGDLAPLRRNTIASLVIFADAPLFRLTHP